MGGRLVAFRESPGVKVAFAAWYFSSQRCGTQRSWALAHGIHPTTLSIWKSESWFRDIGRRWREHYDALFGEVVRALYQRALDVDDPHGVQAARMLAELLGEFPDKNVKHDLDIFTWLSSLPAGPHAEREAAADGA